MLTARRQQLSCSRETQPAWLELALNTVFEYFFVSRISEAVFRPFRILAIDVAIFERVEGIARSKGVVFEPRLGGVRLWALFRGNIPNNYDFFQSRIFRTKRAKFSRIPARASRLRLLFRAQVFETHELFRFFTPKRRGVFVPDTFSRYFCRFVLFPPPHCGGAMDNFVTPFCLNYHFE